MGKHAYPYRIAYEKYRLPGHQPRHVKTRGYRTFLVAMVATSHEELIDCLTSRSPETLIERGLDSWWVAEDDRTDRSDNDSAIFVPRGGQADFASLRNQYLEYHTEEWREDGYPYADTDVSGQWFRG